MSQPPTSYEPYAPGRPGPEPRRGDVEATHGSHAGGPPYGGAPDCLVVASIICVVIWAMSGFGYFWPIWALLPTFLPALLRLPRSLPRALPKKMSAAAGVSGHLQRLGKS